MLPPVLYSLILSSLKNRLAIKIEKTIQGINETNDKTNPSIPAVDGIIINTPAINPHIAVVLLNVSSISITLEAIINVNALSI